MTLTTERQQFAEQNEMSLEFVNWFFDEKKESFGNMWFLMAAAMWEAWKGRDSREAQPVAIGEVRLGQQDDVGCFSSARVICLHEQADWDNFPDGTKLYTAPPSPANARAVAWEMRYWNSGYNMWGEWERITAEQHAEMSVQHAASNDYEFRVLAELK
ncbi:TPA: hypothetical protein ACNH39_003291 [Serratia marcescens]